MTSDGCVIEWCDRRRRVLDMCEMHYRQKKHADETVVRWKMQDIAAGRRER